MDTVLVGQVPGYDPYNSAERPYWLLKRVETVQRRPRIGFSEWWERQWRRQSVSLRRVDSLAPVGGGATNGKPPPDEKGRPVALWH